MDAATCSVERRGDGMNKIIKLIIIALACPLVLPLMLDDEVTE